ncbi:MAG TPA: cellulase family glycosylhydrolase, partial [Solirubrobacteraceae bacterium]|nr:cellulase family glycosylhydrolase [Solirubrobacteraceae bacterium]
VYHRLLVGLLVCTLVSLLLAGSPLPQRTLQTTIQDDTVLLHGTDSSVKSAIGQIASMGFNYVRITAGWSALSPGTTSATIPGAPFDPSNPATYPAGGFGKLDRAVRDAHADGLKVMLDIAFWAPRWAVPLGSPDGQNRYEPNPTLFGDFAKAVAQRYNGAYPDPTQPGADLPAVQLYTIWNEPNESEFLEPQWLHTSAGWVPESAEIYRGMYNNAYAQIKSVDSTDKVLIGATSANGSSTPGQGDVTPIQFVEGLACVDGNLQPLNIPQCNGFQPLKADGYADHPYSLTTTPGASASDTNDVPLANTSRLESLLHRLYGDGRITTNLPLYDTEYGYNTNPPDPYASFTPDQQAQFVGWSTYLAYRDPNTVMFAQFLLRDSTPGPGQPGSRQYWNPYQTGLYYSDGTPKPAAQAFKVTLWAQRLLGPGSPLVTLFGKVPAGTGPQIVQVQSLAADNTWTPIQTLLPSCGAENEFLTNRAGYFVTTAPLLASTATYRLGWLDTNGNWEYGVPIPVDATYPALTAAPELQPSSRGVARKRRR